MCKIILHLLGDRTPWYVLLLFFFTKAALQLKSLSAAPYHSGPWEVRPLSKHLEQRSNPAPLWTHLCNRDIVYYFAKKLFYSYQEIKLTLILNDKFKKLNQSNGLTCSKTPSRGHAQPLNFCTENLIGSSNEINGTKKISRWQSIFELKLPP